MPLIKSIQDVVEMGLCISCGACVAIAVPGAIEMRYADRHGMFFPKILRPDLVDGRGEEFAVCPGKGYQIIGLSKKFGDERCSRNIELGVWGKICAARSTDTAILDRASSGGVMTAIAEYLINTGKVEGAVVTGMQYGKSGPRAKTYIARTRKDLFEAQGSKYCPSPTLLILHEAKKLPGRFAYIGTPCQIAALRMMQGRYPELREKFPYAIGNFCGGFRDCRETDTLILRHGFKPADIVSFRYRGGGQPGSMRIANGKGETAQLLYPQYARRTGYLTHLRCRLCVDATAELADFSCGDAWLPRFSERTTPWSIVMARSNKAMKIIETMEQEKHLVLEEISIDEIKKAQRTNLNSKKTRQTARRRLFRCLGIAMPEFDGGFLPSNGGGVLFEAKVLLSHAVFYSFEKLGLYPMLAKLIRRY